MYPTVIFFRNDSTEIDRICGYEGSKGSYYQTVVDYVNGKNTLGDLLARLNQTPQDVRTNYLLAKKYSARREAAAAQPYYKRILELDPQDSLGFNEECRGYLAVYILNNSGDKQPLYSWLDQISTKENVEWGFNVLIKYYQRKEMQAQVLSAYEQVLRRLPENTDFLNGCAWYIYEQKIRNRYEQGIELAQQALKLKPQAANIWDTLAWLELANGRKEQAINHMRKAIELAPQQPGYLENLKKMEQAEK